MPPTPPCGRLCSRQIFQFICLRCQTIKTSTAAADRWHSFSAAESVAMLLLYVWIGPVVQAPHLPLQKLRPHRVKVLHQQPHVPQLYKAQSLQADLSRECCCCSNAMSCCRKAGRASDSRAQRASLQSMRGCCWGSSPMPRAASLLLMPPSLQLIWPR